MSECDVVVERTALGEPLGDLAEHAATCERCQRLATLPGELAAVPREVDPGVGFTARMTVGAQHVLAARRRRRVVAGIAAATAVAAGAVFVVTRPYGPDHVATAIYINTATTTPDNWLTPSRNANTTGSSDSRRRFATSQTRVIQ